MIEFSQTPCHLLISDYANVDYKHCMAAMMTRGPGLPIYKICTVLVLHQKPPPLIRCWARIHPGYTTAGNHASYYH